MRWCGLLGVLLLLVTAAATAGDSSLRTAIAAALVRPDGARLVQSRWEQEPDIIALYFGADWCVPCHAFTPQLREVYDSLREAGSNTEVVYVSLDSSESDMRRYMRSAAMPWTAISPRRLRTLPAIGALAGAAPPNLVLVGKEGEIIASAWDGRRWLGLQQVLQAWIRQASAAPVGLPPPSVQRNGDSIPTN